MKYNEITEMGYYWMSSNYYNHYNNHEIVFLYDQRGTIIVATMEEDCSYNLSHYDEKEFYGPISLPENLK